MHRDMNACRDVEKKLSIHDIDTRYKRVISFPSLPPPPSL